MTTVIIMPSPASDCTNPHDRETDADTFEEAEAALDRDLKEFLEQAAERFEPYVSRMQELEGDFDITTVTDSIRDGVYDAIQRPAIGV